MPAPRLWRRCRPSGRCRRPWLPSMVTSRVSLTPAVMVLPAAVEPPTLARVPFMPTVTAMPLAEKGRTAVDGRLQRGDEIGLGIGAVGDADGSRRAVDRHVQGLRAGGRSPGWAGANALVAWPRVAS